MKLLFCKGLSDVCAFDCFHRAYAVFNGFVACLGVVSSLMVYIGCFM